MDFWNRFKEYVHDKNPKIRLRTPRPKHWYKVSIGSTDAHITLSINSKENSLGWAIYIKRNKHLFKPLFEQKKKIKSEINKKSGIDKCFYYFYSTIKIKKEFNNIFDQNQFENYFRWLYERMLLFQSVLGKYLNESKSKKLQ